MSAPDSIRDQSSGFGTKAHAVIEDLIISGADDVECATEVVPVKNAFRAWRKAIESMGSKIIKTELEVYSDEFGYAGTMDAVLETIDPKSGERILTALDWKTSNSMRNEYALQVAAYAKAYEERTGEKISRAIVVRFNKKSETYEVKQIHDIGQSFDAFCSALHLYHVLRKPLL